MKGLKPKSNVLATLRLPSSVIMRQAWGVYNRSSHVRQKWIQGESEKYLTGGNGSINMRGVGEKLTICLSSKTVCTSHKSAGTGYIVAPLGTLTPCTLVWLKLLAVQFTSSDQCVNLHVLTHICTHSACMSVQTLSFLCTERQHSTAVCCSWRPCWGSENAVERI